MATGASTADVAILLVDARHGVRAQSRRHAQIARLLGINDYVLAVNKMDLVDFDRDVFDDIVDEFDQILPNAESASDSDERAARRQRDHAAASGRRGSTARRCSSSSRRSKSSATRVAKPFRLPVQLVLRPDARVPRLCRPDPRRASVRPGDAVTVWPSGRSVARQAHRHLGRRSGGGARRPCR